MVARGGAMGGVCWVLRTSDGGNGWVGIESIE